MYHLETTQTDSEHWPSLLGILGTLGIIILLNLLGFVSILVVAYYLPEAGAKAYWFISRSSGVVAYVMITVGVLWGLVQSGSLFRRRVSPVLALGLHSFLNWFGLGLAALHGIILIGDGYTNIDLTKVITPFISPYRPVPVGLGIIGFYLMLLLSLSFYARSHLGQKNFRLLHYGSYGVFIMVTAHSLYSGTDTGTLWWLYTISLVTVVSLTILRIASTRRDTKATGSRTGAQPAAARPQMVSASAGAAGRASRQTPSAPSARPRPGAQRKR